MTSLSEFLEKIYYLLDSISSFLQGGGHMDLTNYVDDV